MKNVWIPAAALLVCAGVWEPRDLLMIPGPIGVRWGEGRFLARLEAAELTARDGATEPLFSPENYLEESRGRTSMAGGFHVFVERLAEAIGGAPPVDLPTFGDGLEVTRRLREWTQIPIIVVSVRDQ